MAPRKFQIGDACLAPRRNEAGEYVEAVVVDYFFDKKFDRGIYTVVRRYGGQRLYGEDFQRYTYELIPLPDAPPNRKARSIVRNNRAIGDRGCSCNCCIHEAIRASDVRADGTYKWDD